MPIGTMDSIRGRDRDDEQDALAGMGGFSFRKLSEMESPFFKSLKQVKNMEQTDTCKIQLGAIVKFKNVKKDLHINDVECVFLGLDFDKDMTKPRGQTLGNKIKIVVKVSAEPFMRMCDIEHVEPVHDLGDVQENLNYVRQHDRFGQKFLDHIMGLKIGGMVATTPLSAYVNLKYAREGAAGAVSALEEAFSKVTEGNFFEERGNGLKILNMEDAGMFDEMNAEAREKYLRDQAREARLRRFAGTSSANSTNPYLVNIR